jgi:copper(I)-binding protein
MILEDCKRLRFFYNKFIFFGIVFLTPWVASAETILVEDGYVRASSKLAKSAAAFMEIRNTSSRGDRLLDVKSDVAKKVELHTHIKSDDGVMKMRRVEDGFVIAGNGVLKLERGGDHIMFMGFSQPFIDGEAISLTLIFEIAGSIELEIPIHLKKRSTSRPHSHTHTHKNSKTHKHEHTHSD